MLVRDNKICRKIKKGNDQMQKKPPSPLFLPLKKGNKCLTFVKKNKVKKAVFLDRDGVINKKPPEGKYITSWKEFKLLANVAKAIQRLNELKTLVIVVTNQRGVALGYMTEQQLKEIHQKMLKKLDALGAHIDAVYYCPHNKGACACRKPKTGLFLKAKKNFPEIDFEQSFVIGDSAKDIKAGKRLGCKTILISSNLQSSNGPKSSAPNFITHSLWQAVCNYIIKI
jgi:D-glycero-D-manno-heptose 1,7-bisphosphate phosphatase